MASKARTTAACLEVGGIVECGEISRPDATYQGVSSITNVPRRPSALLSHIL